MGPGLSGDMDDLVGLNLAPPLRGDKLGETLGGLLDGLGM